MTNASSPNTNGNASNTRTLTEQPLPAKHGFISTLASLRLWVKYRYMFRNTNPPTEVRQGCFVVYQNLCQEIDELLGADKRGFEWTTIADEDGNPVWHWRLCKSLDLKLTAVVADHSLRVGLQQPAGDPEGRLRAAIAARVHAARTAARFMTQLMESTGGAQ